MVITKGTNAGLGDSTQPTLKKAIAMLRTLQELFANFTTSEITPAERESAVQLACAVLLVDVMRADTHPNPAERATINAALRHTFALSDAAMAQLLAQAEQTAHQASDYHQFTSSLNDHFTQPEKIQLVEVMWQVAYADGHLDAHENHLISKIAGLLHVTHGEYIGAKMRAKETALQP